MTFSIVVDGHHVDSVRLVAQDSTQLNIPDLMTLVKIQGAEV